MIPEAAVEAAAKVLLADSDADVLATPLDVLIRAALEAAAPHMLARAVVGDVERIAPDIVRVGDLISYAGRLYSLVDEEAAK